LFKTSGERAKVDISVKEGGCQIEYEGEEPIIRKTFEEELAKNGVECKMPLLSKSWKSNGQKGLK
jgi:hypothetical protein